MLAVASWIWANRKLVGFLAILAASFASGWYIRGNIAEARRNAEIAAAIKDRDERVAAYAEKSKKLEADLADLRRKSRQLSQRLDREIRGNRSYSECVVPDDGLLLLNEAVTGGRTR